MEIINIVASATQATTTAEATITPELLGIGLTFLVSITSIIVSVISSISTNRIAKQASYTSIITPERSRWQYSLREYAALYFAQLDKLCNEKYLDLREIYDRLALYHYQISMLLFKEDKPLQDKLDLVLEKAYEMVKQWEIIQKYVSFEENEQTQEIISNAQNKINKLSSSIINEYKADIFEQIISMIEHEWRKQQLEVSEHWDPKKV